MKCFPVPGSWASSHRLNVLKWELYAPAWQETGHWLCCTCKRRNSPRFAENLLSSKLASFDLKTFPALSRAVLILDEAAHLFLHFSRSFFPWFCFWSFLKKEWPCTVGNDTLQECCFHLDSPMYKSTCGSSAPFLRRTRSAQQLSVTLLFCPFYGQEASKISLTFNKAHSSPCWAGSCMLPGAVAVENPSQHTDTLRGDWKTTEVKPQDRRQVKSSVHFC